MKQSPLFQLDQISDSIKSLAYKVTPSVVRISATGYELRSESNRADFSASRKESIGSGIIVDPAGYIMTNAHVVEGANKITVTRVPVGQRGIMEAVAESNLILFPATLIGVSEKAISLF